MYEQVQRGNRHIKATKEYNIKCCYTFIGTVLGCIYITRYVIIILLGINYVSDL